MSRYSYDSVTDTLKLISGATQANDNTKTFVGLQDVLYNQTDWHIRLFKFYPQLYPNNIITAHTGNNSSSAYFTTKIVTIGFE